MKILLTKILAFIALPSTLLIFTLGASAQAVTPSKIQILTYGIHYGNQIIYRYQVKNDSTSLIDKVDLGINSPQKELPGEPFSLDPAFSDVPAPVPLALCKPFAHMTCSAAVFQFDYMETPRTIIKMRGEELGLSPSPTAFSHSQFIRSGTVSSVAELIVPKRLPDYLSAYGKVWLFEKPRNSDGTFTAEVEIPFTKVDTVSPSITGYARSIKEKGMLAVTVDLKVVDNLDPNPEVSLVSITANETFRPKDVLAAIGTDARSIKLKPKNGRIYYLNYRAIDGSENASFLTIPVPSPREDDGPETKGDDHKNADSSAQK